VTKSPWILIFAVLVNLFIVLDFYGGLRIFSQPAKVQVKLHWFCIYFSIFLVTLVLPSFIFSAALEPGYLRKQYDYIDLVEEMIEGERDLWNLCTYCELIKSQTSFHCLYCKSCIELFDHHCPYINNCLGNRNTKFFLVFVVTYFALLLTMMTETIRFFYESLTDDDSRHIDIVDGNIATALLVLVALN